MDRWGVIGCEERFDEIVDYLCKQAAKRSILKLLGPVTRIIATRWVTQAIDHARRKLEPKPVAKVIDNGDWFVAMTTAPRKECTLEESIESIRNAGWEPTIFAEPGSTATNAETIHNQTRLGVWHNWLASARYAIERSTASVILTVQDDCEFHPDSRTFAESILWPSEKCGFVSLYTPRHYTKLKKGRTNPVGVNRIRTQSLWGACALAWPREILERVIDSKTAKTWSGAGPRVKRGERRTVFKARRDSWFASKDADPSKIANSDTAIGKIVNSLCLTMHFVDPSPVRHIATHSTLGHGGNGGNRNCVRCADHSIPLVDQVNPLNTACRSGEPSKGLNGMKRDYYDENQRRLSALRMFTGMLRDGDPFRAVKFNDGEWKSMAGRVGRNCDNHSYSASLSRRMTAAYSYLRTESYLSDWAVNYSKDASHKELERRLGVASHHYPHFTFLHDLPRNGEFDCRTPELKAFYTAVREDSRRKIFVGPRRLCPEQFLNLRERIDVPLIDAFKDIDAITDKCLAAAKDDPIFLMSCGFISCLLSHSIAQGSPRATVVDLGSAMDPVLFGKTRTSQLPTPELRDFYQDFQVGWGLMPHYCDEVPGWFDFQEFYSRIIRETNGGVLVEVGSWMGKSASYLAVEAFNSGKQFTLDCVDHFRGSSTNQNVSCKIAKTGNIKGACANNLRPFWATATNNNCLTRSDNMLRLVPLDSVKAARLYPDQSIDFCFIDAGHSREEVCEDIDAWLPKIKPGGILAGHDLQGNFPGVRQAVIEKLPRYYSESGNCWAYQKP